MDTATLIAVGALAVSILSSAATFAEKLWGGGNALANKFANLKQETTASIADIRDEFVLKTGQHADNARIGFDAITANIHTLQLGFSDFRAFMAENYMRRDSYYKAAEKIETTFEKKHDELKMDMKDGFKRLEQMIDDVTQIIEANRKSSQQA